MALRKVLVIAYHFPPIQGSSGYLRTLKFVRYLPEHGFLPVVLTVHPRAYPASEPSQLAQIPPEVKVHRSFALDAQKHLSLRGRYPAFLGVPDRWASWIPFGTRDGIALARREGIEILFSTYPIPSAHVIAARIARATGLPWVADFRDQMWDEFLRIPGPALRARQRIEAETVSACARAVCSTEGIRDLFRARYPRVDAGKLQVIPNGFDEGDFQGLVSPPRDPEAPVTAVHLGLLEQVDRDPVPFFRGVRLALDKGWIPAGGFVADLLGSGPEEAKYKSVIDELGLGRVIRIQPPVPYRQALERMARTDLLLLFQGPSCDAQIPAKAYEYMRIGKPVFALTTAEGATGRLIEEQGAGRVVPCNDSETIARALGDWVSALRAGSALPAAAPAAARAFSRQNQAMTLASRFRELLN